jgi:GT2 family glycosyltransferase
VTDYVRAFVQHIIRGWRLARSNPMLFRRRLCLFARNPMRSGRAIVSTAGRQTRVQQSYERWIQHRGRTDCATANEVTSGPTLSVIMPVYNTEPMALSEAIESVLASTYANWELCIADDASTSPHIAPLLAEYARSDRRVRIMWRDRQGHISAASNSAIKQATGEFVVLLDHDDRLTPDALREVARVVQDHPEVDFIYSDEDKLDFSGDQIEPFFKPAWSPTLLMTGNYVTHLAALRRSLVIEVGGFRDAAVGSQDHDLFLRVAERSRAIAHIPAVLYSWRKSDTSTAVGTGAKPYAIEAARMALQEAVDRRKPGAYLQPSHLNGLFFVRYALRTKPSVSLVVVGESEYWKKALNSTGIDICDVTHLMDDRPTGESPEAASIERGVGEYIVCLDSTVRPVDGESVLNLLEHAQLDHVAVVGGRTADARVGELLQAGVVIGDGGQPSYAYAGLAPFPQRNFYLNLKDLAREVSAVPVGCCAVRRDVWQRLGGLRADLPPSLGMPDLCLRAGQAGYDVIYTPLASFESRGPLPMLPSVADYDWSWTDFRDPFWNPNLTPGTSDGLPFRYDGGREARVRTLNPRPRG